MVNKDIDKDIYISDVVDLEKLKVGEFNLIASGTGTGKSYFIANNLPRHLKEKYNINPNEIMFLTSRSLIVDQQTAASRKLQSKNSSQEQEHNDMNIISKFDGRDIRIIRRWNGEETSSGKYSFSDSLVIDGEHEIKTMTYDKLIYLLIYCNTPMKRTLGEVKCFVFDECHTLFTDRFIRDINMLKVWIRDELYHEDNLFIGLTATPNILKYNYVGWGVSLNYLNDESLIRYKVKNVAVCNFEMLSRLFTSQPPSFDGKSIIMCRTIEDCQLLRNEIPNSAILVSKSNKNNFTKEMDFIRSYIAYNETLPEYISESYSDTGKSYKLDVLMTTSTMREGINLREDCGVKNVVCCIPDEIHITQFLGRCRYNVDNLIIANAHEKMQKGVDPYVLECHREFANFLKDGTSIEWFDKIKHITDCEHPIRIALDKTSFEEYIFKEWIIPEKIIVSEDDKNKILQYAISSKILNKSPSNTTFNAVIKYIETNLGYQIESGRTRIEGKQNTYKKISKREGEMNTAGIV